MWSSCAVHSLSTSVPPTYKYGITSSFLYTGGTWRRIGQLAPCSFPDTHARPLPPYHYHSTPCALAVLLQSIGHLAARLELARHRRDRLGDDERRAGLVDQNGVCLVHQAEVEALASGFGAK